MIILWNDVKILHKEIGDRYKRAFSEMVFIKKENDEYDVLLFMVIINILSTLFHVIF